MESMRTDKIAYLAQIQGVINRMSAISAAFKGLAIALFVGTVAIVIGADGYSRVVVFLVLVAVFLVVAGFDSWYLLMEKRYRVIYEDVLNEKHSIDFDMSCGHGFGTIKLINVISSKSIWLFYSACILACAALMLLCELGVL